MGALFAYYLDLAFLFDLEMFLWEVHWAILIWLFKLEPEKLYD